ncbi:MAG: anion transporter [Nitrososphaerales archaeon]
MSFGTVQSYVALAVFVATYAALVLRNVGRKSAVPIWMIFLAGAAAMVLSGSIGVPEAYAAVNLQVIVFLFSMFVLVTALEISGALEAFASGLLRRARRPQDVLYLSFFGFAFLSMVLMNDTIALMGTPIVITIARKTRMPVQPLLLTLAFAVTIGSAATPMGNPQNLLVAVTSGLEAPVLQFAYFLLIPVLIDLALTALLLRVIFRRDLEKVSTPIATGAEEEGEASPRDPRDPRLARKATAAVVLTMAGILLVNVVAIFGVQEPFGISEVSFFGAVLLLVISGRGREILERLDWGILVLFAGLFVLMQAVSDNGIISLAAGYLPPISVGHPAAATSSILVSSVVLSQVLSNVPMVALYVPLMKTLGFTASSAYAWATLAAGSTLAGNLTLLGAASNLIVAQGAERQGHRLGFLEFMKVGVLVTALDVAVLYAYLFFVVVVLA